MCALRGVWGGWIVGITSRDDARRAGKPIVQYMLDAKESNLQRHAMQPSPNAVFRPSKSRTTPIRYTH